MDTLVRLGRAGGHGDGERWRRQRSGALGEERTREEGEQEGGEKDRGGAWRRSRHPDEEGRGRQAGREVAWPAERACVGTQLLGEGGKTTEEGGPGGLGHLLAGPACCCWAAQGRAPGKLLLFIYFCFLISDICFDLIKILNHLIT